MLSYIMRVIWETGCLKYQSDCFLSLSLRNLVLKQEYRSDRDDLVSEFFVPCLSNCSQFDRSIQHVTAKSVSTLSTGFVNFANSNSKIRIITGHRFKSEDLTILSSIFNELKKNKTTISNLDNNNSIDILKKIIFNNKLEIKIAIPDPEVCVTFAENIGIFKDSENNVVAFSGTSNETFSTQNRSFESIDVFTSWDDESRVETKIKDFDNLWENKTNHVRVCDFTFAEKNNLLKYIF